MEENILILTTITAITTVYIFIKKKLKHIKEFNLKTRYFEITYKKEDCGGKNENKTNNNN